MNSEPIPTFNIKVSTLKDSIGITSMTWDQARSEKWVLSPLENVRPNLKMLTKEGYTVPKNIHDYPWQPIKGKGERTKEQFHSCFITFDRSYVVWWYGQQLKPLIDADDKLIFDIALESGIPEISTFLQESATELTLKDLRLIADSFGYRIHKKEASRMKKPKDLSFKIS